MIRQRDAAAGRVEMNRRSDPGGELCWAGDLYLVRATAREEVLEDQNQINDDGESELALNGVELAKKL